jgi:hypothetical protein
MGVEEVTSSFPSTDFLIDLFLSVYEEIGLVLENFNLDATVYFEVRFVGVLQSLLSWMTIFSFCLRFFVVSEHLSLTGLSVSKSSISIAIFLRLLDFNVLSPSTSLNSGFDFYCARNLYEDTFDAKLTF